MNSAQSSAFRVPINRDLSRSQLFAITNGKLISIEDVVNGTTQFSRKLNTVIDRKYQILEFVGRGGMSEVYRARHLMLDKVVALKTFTSSSIDDAAKLRFQREAQAIARLNHPNVIQIFDFGLAEDGVPYYTMEFLHGHTLAEILENTGPPPLETTLAYFIQAAQALSVAHGKDIVHRDLKPGNIFVEAPEATNAQSKIVDFGIASLIERTPAGQSLTAGGIVFGTPLYISPEQAMGKRVTEQADIYSLGCTLFEALTGKPPLEGPTAVETVGMHLEAVPPTLMKACNGREFPIKLERVVAKMLAKSPSDRQTNMEQVARDLALVKLILTSRPQNDWRSAVSIHHEGDEEAYLEESQDEFDDDDHAGEALTTTSNPKNNSLFAFSLAAMSLLASISIACAWACAVISGSPEGRPKSPAPESDTQAKSTRLPDVRLGQMQMDDQGNLFYLLKFKEQEDFGKFSYSLSPERYFPARGDVKLKTRSGVIFHANERFLANPENIATLRPIVGLGLVLKTFPDGELRKRCFTQIGKLDDLAGLSILDGKVNDQELKAIHSLKSLAVLSIDSSAVDGETIAKLPYSRKLLSVSLRDTKNISKFLEAMQYSTALRHLYLESLLLSESDIQRLSKYPALRTLLIPESCIRDKDMQTLTKLVHLQTLNVQHCQLTGASLPALKTMARHGLKHLKISGKGFNSQEIALLKKLVADCQFEEDLLAGPLVPSMTEMESY